MAPEATTKFTGVPTAAPELRCMLTAGPPLEKANWALSQPKPAVPLISNRMTLLVPIARSRSFLSFGC